MNIPMSWLKEYASIDADTAVFIREMTMSGTKVESVMQVGSEINKVVVGKIIKLEKHPDADKLVVGTVDIGKDEPLQIVTGADNVYEGAYVPIALDGATLTGGVKIKKGKLRGVESNGMMCSIEELGYTTHDFPEAPENGIYIFQSAQIPGADVKEILELSADVVEYELTSNRSDCHSVVGVAREAAATFNTEFKYPEITVEEKAEGDIDKLIKVEILNPDLCPRYIARVVKNVKIMPSPQWMRRRLTLAGIRPINNIVDITNYVMLELGQPMHAFDIDNIDERKIIIRNAADGEMFTTLDGIERKLDSSMLVIADCNKAVAIAGIMGGENSMITENATAILFESANFNGTNIRVSAKKLGMRTDASSRYEKGLDPNLALEAVNRAVQLVEELACGQVVKGFADCYPNKRLPWTVSYNPKRINALLGTDISPDAMAEYLERLQIKVEKNISLAHIPTFRPDILCEADIAEEVARMYGYDNIPVTLASGEAMTGKKSGSQILEDIVKDTVTAMGFYEALNYSFESPKVFDKLKFPADSSLRNAVKIINPIGEDYSVMRTTTLNYMLQSLSLNFNRRNESVSLFEVSHVYLPKSMPLSELPDEVLTLTMGMYGGADFYSIKGAVEKLLEVLGIKNQSYVPEKEYSHMHPGRTARIMINGSYVGYVGEVHPEICESYELAVKTYVAVCDLDILFKYANLERKYANLPKFPDMRRDIALLAPDSLYAADIEKAIREKGGNILEAVEFFDVYKGKQIAEGYKSIAFNITFRAADRTLTDDEVASAMEKIIKNVEEKTSAKLRT